MLRAAPLLVLLSACALDEDRFVERFADDYCARHKACDEIDYFTIWGGGTPECTADVGEVVGDKAFGNGDVACRWQSDPAQACLDRVTTSSCDSVLGREYVDDCTAEVWDCVSLTRRW